MEYKEAMLWLTTMEMAEKGDEPSIQHLQAENKIRAEKNLPTVQEEINAMIEKGRQM